MCVDRICNFTAAMAALDAPQTGHSIKKPVAFAVPQPDAVATGNYTAVLRSKRAMVGKRVQVMGRIERLQICGGKVLDHIIRQD